MKNYQRILIIGCCGSGKSTLSLKLGETLNLPVVHLDKLYWKDNWVEKTDEEFKCLLMDELVKDRWIIEGNYIGTLPLRLEFADMVIYLDYPTWLCMYGILKRLITTHGEVRVDMADNCPERFDLDFIKYTFNFNRNNRERILEILSKYPDVKIYRINNRKNLKTFLKNILTLPLGETVE